MAEGEFALVRRHLAQALQTLSWPTEWGSMGSDLDVYAMLADAATQQRDEAALRQYAPLAEELAGRYGHTLYQAIAHRAWGVAHRLAGDYTESEARLQKAMELFQQLDTRWQIGRTWFEWGELRKAQKNMSQARDYFQRALSAFAEMRAVPDEARTLAMLESLN